MKTEHKGGSFSPLQWRIKKYGDKSLDFLAPEVYGRRLEKIERTINKTVQEAQTEFQEELHTSYDIVGAIIYGSWARGDVHKDSDLDLFVITSQDPVDLTWDFMNRLRKNGLRMKIEIESHVLTSDKEGIEAIVAKKALLIGEHARVVTPYPHIALLFQEEAPHS